MIKLKSFWNYLHSSLWFLPTILVVFSILLSIVFIGLESSQSGYGFLNRILLFGSGAEEARIMLSTIAGSMMSIVGITFSMTLVVLALASSQYTSRILRNFMQNRITQLVIGFFVGIFTYCLIVLCTIRDNTEGEFIPRLAVFIAFILAIGGVVVLIFFIHHIASSIQASSILSSITKETISTINRIYPNQLKNESIESFDENSIEALDKIKWFPILAKKNGYIESVSITKLIRLAVDKKTTIRLEQKIGEFTIQDAPLASLSIKPEDDLIDLINSSFVINKQRILDHDVSFGIRQLVDIALKALSPGINDTTTAVMCLNYLTAIMVQLASRKLNSSYHDEENELKVISNERTFKIYLEESFDQIRESAPENVEIILKLIESLRIIATKTMLPSRLEALNSQIRWISEIMNQRIKPFHNRKEIHIQIAQFHMFLKERQAAIFKSEII